MSKRMSTSAVHAGFGVAAAALYAAPEVQADVVNLTFSNNSSVAWTSNSNLQSVSMFSTGSNNLIGNFSVWNDSVGKSFSNVDLNSWTVASVGQEIKVSTFSGTSSGISFPNDDDTTAYIAFRTANDLVGWFSVELGGLQGDIIFTGGQYGNGEESVTVGSTPGPVVPGIGGLAALAVGATGLRGRRQRVAG